MIRVPPYARRISPAAALLLFCACGRTRPPLQTFNTVPDFSLTAETGAEFRFSRELAGKVWVADFIFTNCAGPCPRMSRQMSQIQSAVKGMSGVRLVSFTVDPARDTPEALAVYARRNGADPALWSFLTGPMSELHNLARNVFLLGSVTGELDHSTRFVLVDRQGRIRRYYDTTEAGVTEDIVADIGLLSKEPS
jgi:cytochrome oxidase Cu insertion factor (SCO1/SenC/PrrC family)